MQKIHQKEDTYFPCCHVETFYQYDVLWMTSSNVFLWPCFPETLRPRLGQASRMLQRIVDQEPLSLGGGEQRGIGRHKARERHVVLLRLAVD